MIRRYFIAFGSNIDAETNILKAMTALSKSVSITGISTFYRTKPIGFKDANDFINGVCRIESPLAPIDLKEKVLKRIEGELGRTSQMHGNCARSIDLDILLYVPTTAHVSDPFPCTPDPDIQDRPFYAIPLGELSPNLILPQINIPIQEIIERFRNNNMIPLEALSLQLQTDLL